MPIDFLSRRNTAEDAITNLIAGRSPADEVSRTMANVQNSRSGFLGSTGLDPRAFVSKVPALQRKLEGLGARQKLTGQQQRWNMIYNNLMDKAVSSGMERQAADTYARKVADQNTEMAFTAGEAEKERAHARDINTMYNQYDQAGINLQNEYRPKTDYESALIRVLTGTASSVLTSHYQKKNLFRSTTPTMTRQPVSKPTLSTSYDPSQGSFIYSQNPDIYGIDPGGNT